MLITGKKKRGTTKRIKIRHSDRRALIHNCTLLKEHGLSGGLDLSTSLHVSGQKQREQVSHSTGQGSEGEVEYWESNGSIQEFIKSTDNEPVWCLKNKPFSYKV